MFWFDQFTVSNTPDEPRRLWSIMCFIEGNLKISTNCVDYRFQLERFSFQVNLSRKHWMKVCVMKVRILILGLFEYETCVRSACKATKIYYSKIKRRNGSWVLPDVFTKCLAFFSNFKFLSVLMSSEIYINRVSAAVVVCYLTGNL